MENTVKFPEKGDLLAAFTATLDCVQAHVAKPMGSLPSYASQAVLWSGVALLVFRVLLYAHRFIHQVASDRVAIERERLSNCEKRENLRHGKKLNELKLRLMKQKKCSDCGGG